MNIIAEWIMSPSDLPASHVVVPDLNPDLFIQLLIQLPNKGMLGSDT